MQSESTKVAKSSREVPIVRVRVDDLMPLRPLVPEGERLRPLVPEGRVEEGTLVEKCRATAYWASGREATRR